MHLKYHSNGSFYRRHRHEHSYSDNRAEEHLLLNYNILHLIHQLAHMVLTFHLPAFASFVCAVNSI
ncbi:hypothetical protein DM02DRAFT_408147 [Periconia macrospinosa]|uniref:Uncharacterized protein n=1 Tax=Periconia macrospinosa TaxID=97972 RepID=A0A2V1EAV5_9PLEO|nr:hypothetical protein DM02DRAFT_408147 [Periconia macrospinosa]